MTPTIFILILNPVASSIFAAALFILWHQQRHLGYIALLAIAFVLKTCAYLLQFVTLTGHVSSARILSNTLFMATAVVLLGGVIGRYGVRPPYRAMIVVSAIAIAILTFFQLVVPDDGMRVVALNAGIGIVVAIGAWTLRRLARRTFIEQMLVCLMLLHVVGAVARPALFFWSGSPSPFGINSIYWLGVTASDLIVSMLVVLCVFTMVALDVFARLRAESVEDSLSGLLNRRGFEERASGHLASAMGADQQAVLVLADIDNFKVINDTFGHAAGDQVIVTFACALAGEAPDNACLGRVGGEEFAVLLPGADAHEAARFAERVRLSFSLTPLPVMPSPRNVTASFGIAVLPPGGRLEAAMRSADQALYRAKEEGRDCVRIAGSSAPVLPLAQWAKLA